MKKLEVSGQEYAQKLRDEQALMFQSLKKDLEGRIKGILADVGCGALSRKEELLEEEEEGEPLLPVRYGFEEGNDGFSLERVGSVFVRPDGRIGYRLVFGYGEQEYVVSGLWELYCLFDWLVWCVGTME